MNDQYICLTCDEPVDLRNPLCACTRKARAQMGAGLATLRARVSELEGDLNIARLQRDAKLCSECPRMPEFDAMKANDARYRWLRTVAWRYTDYDTGEELDELCDSAIAKGKEG